MEEVLVGHTVCFDVVIFTVPEVVERALDMRGHFCPLLHALPARPRLQSKAITNIQPLDQRSVLHHTGVERLSLYFFPEIERSSSPVLSNIIQVIPDYGPIKCLCFVGMPVVHEPFRISKQCMGTKRGPIALRSPPLFMNKRTIKIELWFAESVAGLESEDVIRPYVAQIDGQIHESDLQLSIFVDDLLMGEETHQVLRAGRKLIDQILHDEGRISCPRVEIWPFDGRNNSSRLDVVRSSKRRGSGAIGTDVGLELGLNIPVGRRVTQKAGGSRQDQQKNYLEKRLHTEFEAGKAAVA